MKFNIYKFKGMKVILVKGAITTPEDYKHGRPSYAHLWPSGISRYGQKIGTKKDLIKTKATVNVEPNMAEFLEGLLGPGWF